MSEQVNSSEESSAESERVGFPPHALQEVEAQAEEIRKGLGLGAVSRESAAQAMGHNSLSGNARQKLGAQGAFGFLSRVGKGAVQLSPLAKAILLPTNQAERQAALVKAVKQPKLYGVLIERFGGHALPNMLTNILVREYGINPKQADGVAADFRASVEYAGLLRNGILYADAVGNDASEATEVPKLVPQSVGSFDRNQVVYGALSVERPMTAKPPMDPGYQSFAVPLTAGRMATVSLPIPLRQKDLEKLSLWVNYMTATVEDIPDPSNA